ncbi:PilT/PilU family type 4a pilus ATPase [Pelagibaculum spongiae]|uniref:Type IV pili twitching motility protein PilT n=1 Tax=Pelagibaculum spongiae TaxID=2080658 RepID=A0A2V1GYG5_9GAMM|nr:PilT/PilU family type 4a pilus ATPase [Pelagibaculum spongiae]PVZ67785.1 type IV pili twitching motility protein PilT [Pelagibaculum spongiae]
MSLEKLHAYLTTLSKHDGSDLYLSTGAPPCGKFQGNLKPLSKEKLVAGEVKEMAYAVMDKEQLIEFEEQLEMNLAISLNKIGRFRVNIFRQRNEISIVARNIKADIPSFDSLGLPPQLKEIINTKRGLVLFIGGTGSGKSTSLAALIDHRNSTSSGHIITIEDPIEYVHKHKRCIINQREVGVDTRSYRSALKQTLRQAPDVILIGEIRDRETMEHALAFAETGHLAISTLHANNSNQAIDRIINFFPEERRQQLIMDLAMNLKAFISQRLIKTVDGKRCAAVEVLLGTATIREKILNQEFTGIKAIMEKSEPLGMQTFDSALFKLYKQGLIDFDQAIKNSDSPNNLRLKIKLASENAGIPSDESAMSLVMDSDPSTETEEPEAEISHASPHTPAAKKVGLSLELDSSHSSGQATDNSASTSSVGGMAQFKIDG